MEIKHRKKHELTDIEKRLEMKINEHMMLTNTLHEAMRRKDISESTINGISNAISETLNDIAFLRSEETNSKSKSVFDRIEKQPIKVLSGNEPKYNYKRQYKVKSPEDIMKESRVNDEINDILQKRIDDNKLELINLSDKMHVDNILFSNRFLLDLDVIGIPATMVKWAWVSKGSENFIEVQIYDFIDDNGVPVLAKLAAYDGRKFTAEIKHLDPTGCVVYREKFNGCYVEEEYVRDALTYSESEPSTITLRIRYDGVSYEAGR